jgi:hypothetical protein
MASGTAVHGGAERFQQIVNEPRESGTLGKTWGGW